MSHSLDYLVITAFVFVQWRVTVLLLRFGQKRLSGPRLGAARRAIVGLDVLLVMGFIASYSEVISTLGLPPRIAPVFGAATLMYIPVAGALVAIHAAWKWSGRRAPAGIDPGRRNALKAAGGALVAVPVGALGYGTFIERLNFHVREVEVPVSRLPADLDGIRILQLSDIHLSAFLSERTLERVIDSANELKPHLAVVTGDLISSRGDPLDACIRQIARLRSDSGVWGCLGNHERFAQVENYTTAASARLGVRFLRSRAVPLRFGDTVLNLAGVDYQPFSDRKSYLAGKGRLVAPGAFNILLSHNPDVFPVAAHQGYNLLLAGHTHGGQISVEILDQAINPARFFTRFVYGLYRSQSAAAYVTRGIGTIGLPTRIGAPPEISLLRLRKG